MIEYQCAICGKMKCMGQHYVILGALLYEDDCVAYICSDCKKDRWRLTEEQQELYQCVIELEQIKKREEALAAKLQMAVPDTFSEWLGEAGDLVIENLIEFGFASRKYRRAEDDGQIYGYTDLDEFEQRFKQLEAAWSGAVSISISWDERYRFEITFTAI